MTPQDDITGTRLDLIRAALHLFGQKGYDGASTRAIADRAQTNVASIAYHFGGKAGLHEACADMVASRVARAVAPVDAAPLPDTRDAARRELHAALRAFVRLIVASEEAREMVAFITREVSEPGAIADRLFDTVFLPRHRRFCALWEVITGSPAEAEEVKLTVFALIGQVTYFRIAQPFVARRMGWEAVTPAEADRIADVLIRNLDVLLDGGRP